MHRLPSSSPIDVGGETLSPGNCGGPSCNHIEAGLRTKLTMQKEQGKMEVGFLVISLPHHTTSNPAPFLAFSVIEI